MLSHVIHYGTGVFEGLRLYQVGDKSAVFRLNAHTKRLFDTYCISCHGPLLSQKDFPLTTYQEVTANTYSNIGGIIENRRSHQGNCQRTKYEPTGIFHSDGGFLHLPDREACLLHWRLTLG